MCYGCYHICESQILKFYFLGFREISLCKNINVYLPFILSHTVHLPPPTCLYTHTRDTHGFPPHTHRMVTGQCLLPVSLAPTWSSTRVLLDTVHVPSTVMLVTPPVCTPTLTVTQTDSAHVIEKV